MNKIILAGRLTRDAEIRYTSGAEQTAIARMSIAVDRRYKKDGAPSADFFQSCRVRETCRFLRSVRLERNEILNRRPASVWQLRK